MWTGIDNAYSRLLGGSKILSEGQWSCTGYRLQNWEVEIDVFEKAV